MTKYLKNTYPIGHYEHGLAFLALPWFHLSHQYGAHVLVFVDDGHNERPVQLPVEGWQVVDEGNEGFALVPRAYLLIYPFFKALAGLARAWQEEQILVVVEAQLLEIWKDFVLALVVPGKR